MEDCHGWKEFSPTFPSFYRPLTSPSCGSSVHQEQQGQQQEKEVMLYSQESLLFVENTEGSQPLDAAS